MSPRPCLADGHAAIRQGDRAILEGGQVIDEPSRGHDALQLARKTSFQLSLLAMITVLAIASTKPAHAVPAFTDQTGQPCQACHVGGFGPHLTPFGREFKLGGYTTRTSAAIPISAMAIASFTHTRKD
jgi:hypothetical protein